MAKRVADIVVETLQAAGVKHCWGVPGDTLNFVTDAIRRSGIEWVHVRHEEVAGFAAGAEAMLTGDLTACAGSCGPGSLEFMQRVSKTATASTYLRTESSMRQSGEEQLDESARCLPCCNPRPDRSLALHPPADG